MFPEYTFGCSAIMAIFQIIFFALFPEVLWESMTFQLKEGLKGHIISLGFIIYFLGFINFIVIVVNKI